MAPVPPVSDFDYSNPPSRGTRTPNYVKRAFGPGREDSVKRFFNRASALMQEHLLYSESFVGVKHPRKALEQKRNHVADFLEAGFRINIEIASHPQFALHLCRGVLMYQSGAGGTVKVGEELEELVER